MIRATGVTGRLAACGLVAIAVSCHDAPPVAPRGPVHLGRGLMEITMSGLGGPGPVTTSVRSLGGGASVARPAAGRAIRLATRGPLGPLARTLSVLPDSTSTVDGTVQLQAVSTSSFTTGTRTTGGFRYVSATYRVRNASDSGVAYGDARTNLTFLATATSGTLSGTAISKLKRFDGSDANPSIAAATIPTGFAVLTQTGQVTAVTSDVLQVYTEAELSSLTPPVGATPLPYGFVVRNPDSTSNRTLAPNADTYDGLVTFAFRVPLQAAASDDPYTISIIVLPVDDNEVHVTQSLEEQDATSAAAVKDRASHLSGNLRALFATTVSGGAATDICSVRLAGTAVAPTAWAFDTLRFHGASPAPFTAGAGAISPTTSFTRTSGSLFPPSSEVLFVVNGTQSGRLARSGITGVGATTLATPSLTLFPNEEVDVVVTRRTRAFPGACPATSVTDSVFRYRVRTAAALGPYDTAATPATSVSTVSFRYHGLAAGDLNGDGKLDLVAVSSSSVFGQFATLLGDGSGGFGAPTQLLPAYFTPDTGSAAQVPLVLGDVNGDGKLDLVVAGNSSANGIGIYLGDGSGGFTFSTSYSAGTCGGSPCAPASIAVGDVNGDGNLDVVAGSQTTGAPYVVVFLGDGAGHFTRQAPIALSASCTNGGAEPVLGDVNDDGILDLVAGCTAGTDVRLGDGAGGFAEKGFHAGTNTGTPTLGDINGDGKLDFVTPGIQVFLGDGAGNFTEQTAVVSASIVRSSPVVLGDVDGDGKLDMLYRVHGTSDSVAVQLGDGAGGFAPVSQRLNNPNGANLVVGDFTGDGKLDVAVLRSTSGDTRVSLWRNH